MSAGAKTHGVNAHWRPAPPTAHVCVRVNKRARAQMRTHARTQCLISTRAPERGDGQGLQVQQLGGRRVLLREDEVPEGHRQHRLAPQPLVAHHLYITDERRFVHVHVYTGVLVCKGWGVAALRLPPQPLVAHHLCVKTYRECECAQRGHVLVCVWVKCRRNPFTHLDKVLGRERLVHGHGEGDQVLLLGQSLLEDEVLVVQDKLCIWVKFGVQFGAKCQGLKGIGVAGHMPEDAVLVVQDELCMWVKCG